MWQPTDWAWDKIVVHLKLSTPDARVWIKDVAGQNTTIAKGKD